MALRGSKRKLTDVVKKAAKGVHDDILRPDLVRNKTLRKRTEDDPKAKATQTRQPITSTIVEVEEAERGRKPGAEFVQVVVSGVKGDKYRIHIPKSYASAVPKQWDWNQERYRVAELIAQGIPIAHIVNYPEVNVKSRMTIYGWLEHPEFKEHVDGLISETGWASRRERLSNLQRINDLLMNKLVTEIDKVKMTDKSIGPILSALQAGSKLIAQEKGEFVEEAKITQDTNVTASVSAVTASVDDIMQSMNDEERRAMEKELNEAGDAIIRQLTGGVIQENK